jgi:hypothetical protein
MTRRHEGGCLCGKLRYAISGEPLATIACHCRDCQVQSGSAFGMTMVVKREHFEWLSGEPRKFAMKADSGTDKDCLFCGDCGVRILNELSRLPATVNLKPGTLDDTSWLQPRAHVWVASKQPWTPIPESSPQFEQNPRPGAAVNKAAE